MQDPIGKQGSHKELALLASSIGYPNGPSENLVIAFTHRSFANEALPKVQHNERLEFLGDAVLDLIVADELMRLLPEAPEGQLHRLRTTLVCTDSLAEFSVELGIGRLLRLGKGELKAKGRSKTSLLANAFEAMIGAMYLDFGYQETSRVVLRLLAKALKTVQVPEASEHDPKSELQQRCQKAFGTPPSYSVKHASGPEHEKVFTVEVAIDGQVLALGEGRSKKLAERDAARNALIEWKGEG